MTLSIITIAKNEEKTIERTISSVVNQSAFGEIEYIVIDGSSSDNTLSIIKKYDGIKLISEPDNGIYSAFNKGIKASGGDYILFLNAGDELINDKVIENVLPNLTSPVVFFDIETVDKDGKRGTFFYENLDDLELFYKSLPHPSTFIKRELFDKIGLYNEENKIVSDWEWFLEYFNSGGNYQYIKEKTTLFYLGGISSNKKTHSLLKSERKKVRDKYYSKKRQLLYKLILKLPFKRELRRLLAEKGVIKMYEKYKDNNNMPHFVV